MQLKNDKPSSPPPPPPPAVPTIPRSFIITTADSQSQAESLNRALRDVAFISQEQADSFGATIEVLESLRAETPARPRP